MSNADQSRRPTPTWLTLAGVLCAAAACEGSPQPHDGAASGTSTGGSIATGGGPALGPATSGPRPLLRLSRREYNNTVRDLLGDTTHPADAFPDDRDRTFLFRRAGLVATQDADLLRTAAEALAATAVKTRSKLVTCDAGGDEAACAAKFISEFGLRAYRRPLSTAESAHLTDLYRTARGELALGFDAAIGLLLEAILQAPSFLYHWESPYDSPRLEDGAVALSAYDLASRLSYFIWGSMPDQALFDAAAQGKLASDADLAAQARRMLADDKAKDNVSAFFREWLELDQLTQLPKDAASYPDYNPELQSALLGGTDAFVRHVVFDADGKLETLLTANFTFSDQLLGKVYDNTASGSTLTLTMLDSSKRLGLLGEPAFLSITGSPDGSNPVKRGKAVYTKLLCGELPPPPPNVPPAKPASAGGTTRQRFTEHDQNVCATACHSLMDPIGFAFEHYDGIGRYRTQDNGQPVDSTGTLTLDGQGRSFADAVELARLLSTSDSVRSCFAKQWLRFALGRAETTADADSLATIGKAFAAGGYVVPDLLPSIVASRSFRFRSLAEGEPTP